MHFELPEEPTDFTADMECEGLVFDIQRNAVHNGPGTRTAIFLSGHPLKNLWSRASDDSGACAPHDLAETGEKMTVAALLQEILKDREVFEKTGGGVTFSGGEPFAQPWFLLQLLKACRGEGVHTCVESSLCVPWEDVDQALPYIKFFITDIPHMDPEKYRAVSGRDPKLAMENIRKLARAYRDTNIRIPMIPGFNDDAENIGRIGLLIDEEFGINLMEVQLLPFKAWDGQSRAPLNAAHSLEALQKNECADCLESMRRAQAIIKEQGLPAYIVSKAYTTAMETL